MVGSAWHVPMAPIMATMHWLPAVQGAVMRSQAAPTATGCTQAPLKQTRPRLPQSPHASPALGSAAQVPQAEPSGREQYAL